MSCFHLRFMARALGVMADLQWSDAEAATHAERECVRPELRKALNVHKTEFFVSGRQSTSACHIFDKPDVAHGIDIDANADAMERRTRQMNAMPACWRF